MMTYGEFAEAIGRSLPAARAMAIRKNWRRIVGNDGKARVAIPIEVLERPRKPEALPDDEPEALPDDMPEGDADDLSVVALLRAQVGRLEADLERATTGLDEARAALEVERIRAAQVDVLRAMLDAERLRVEDANRRVEDVREIERQRVEDVKAERDRWAAQADKLIPLAETGTRTPAWWPFRRRA